MRVDVKGTGACLSPGIAGMRLYMRGGVSIYSVIFPRQTGATFCDEPGRAGLLARPRMAALVPRPRVC